MMNEFMTQLLFVCLILACLALVGTVALLFVPVLPSELQFWHFLRIQSLRGWITRTREVSQPLHKERTLIDARTNLRWHLILTGLFCGLIGRAISADAWWLRVPAALLVIPAIAYFLGSLVQRQKIAILHLRMRQ
jgi:hypothetical protein